MAIFLRDLYYVPTGRVERNTAIQVKRYTIKIESDDADYSRQIQWMNDLFAEGVRQANENEQPQELTDWLATLKARRDVAPSWRAGRR